MSGSNTAAESIVELILQYRFSAGHEVDLQEGLCQVLGLHHIPYIREHDLGNSFGRIDFFLPAPSIGIELKIKGSPSGVLRQLHRYSLCPAIAALILVTGRDRLARVPPALNGKPLLTAALWQGQL